MCRITQIGSESAAALKLYLHDVWIKLIVPALSDLLACTVRQEPSYKYPTLVTMLLYKLSHFPIFLQRRKIRASESWKVLPLPSLFLLGLQNKIYVEFTHHQVILPTLSSIAVHPRHKRGENS